MAKYLIPVGQKSRLIQVAPGKYNVQVTADGYTQQIEGGVDVTVNYGETVEVDLGTMRVNAPSEETREGLFDDEVTDTGGQAGGSSRTSTGSSSEGDGGKNTSVILLAVVAIAALAFFSRR